MSYMLLFAFNRYMFQVRGGLTETLGLIPTSLISYAFGIVLNIVMAVLVYADKQALNIKTHYVIVATVLYPPVGVVAFLLFALYDEGKADEVSVS